MTDGEGIPIDDRVFASGDHVQNASFAVELGSPLDHVSPGGVGEEGGAHGEENGGSNKTAGEFHDGEEGVEIKI